MTDHDIIDLFDSSSITLADLAMQSGRSVKELKALLMGDKKPALDFSNLEKLVRERENKKL